MIRRAISILVLAASPAGASDDEFDPAQVSVADAINCYLDAPTYNSFAQAIMGEDKLAERHGWRKIEGGNPFLAEYELPESVPITGDWATRRIAFSSSGVMAILDLTNPAQLAANEEIENAADAWAEASPEAAEAAAQATNEPGQADGTFGKFLGQRVIVDETEPANERDAFSTHTVIARSISNVTSHPGKTLYGCSYRIELLDRDGKPL